MDQFSQHEFEEMNEYFTAGATASYAFRKRQLQTLLKAIKAYEQAIYHALKKDLHKSVVESFYSEVGIVQAETRIAIKHLADWMAPQKVSSPLVIFPSESKIVRDALGVCLVIAPWNYPCMLLLSPMVGAIAGGNCVVLKPSELAPHTAAVITKMIKEYFEPRYIRIVEGDGAVVVPQMMKENRFSHIFFTGSTTVGKEIARMAAEKLVPVTLELGGKSPCIVDEDADIAIAAKRIAWGKFTNAGQTCVAPDYLLVHSSRKDALVEEMKKAIRKFYGDDAQQSPDYGRIINSRRFDKLTSYLQQGTIITGGNIDKNSLYISPTLMDNVPTDVAVMQEEIFGPILPILTYTTNAEAIHIISKNPQPLALYYFGNNRKKQRYFMSLHFGGGCINNTLVHLGNLNLPFGGLGRSGTGAYHGKFSFDTFTRQKSLVKSGTWTDPSIKYPPYEGRLPLFKKLFKWL